MTVWHLKSRELPTMLVSPHHFYGSSLCRDMHVALDESPHGMLQFVGARLVQVGSHQISDILETLSHATQAKSDKFSLSVMQFMRLSSASQVLVIETRP